MFNFKPQERVLSNGLKDDNFTKHLQKVLAGHYQRGTRMVHLITTVGMMSSLLLVVSCLTNMPFLFFVAMAGANFIKWSDKRIGLAVISTVVVAITGLLVQTVILTSASDEYWLWAAGKCLLSFLLFGGVEEMSHVVFKDGDMNLITKKHKGFPDKALAILFDVILPAPMFFLCLNLTDFGFVHTQAWWNAQVAAADVLRQTE